MPAASVRTLLALATPMVLARATQSAVTFADLVQVKHLGKEAVAATATGALNVMGVAILAMGTVFIVQSFVAQLAGRGDVAASRRFAWYGLAIAAIAAVVAALLIAAIDPLLALSHYSDDVKREMGSYMTIRLLSVGGLLGVEALGNWYGGLGNTRMQMYAAIVTMVVAIAFNWLLIDGHLGAPALGVDGAAWASTIASWVGFAVIGFGFWRGWGAPAAARAASQAPASKEPMTLRELGRVLKFGLPNGVNWFLEFTAFQVFVNVVLASLGDDTVAALNAVLAVNSISFMPAFGLSSAGAILAGRAIGRNDRDSVVAQVKVTLACNMAWMGGIGVLYLVMPRTVLDLFDEPGKSGRLVDIGVPMLAISAAWQVFDAVNLTLSETLRAAGDTAWPAYARIALAWLVFTPAAYISVEWLDGGAVTAMICLVAYIGLLAGLLLARFRGGAWRRIELVEPQLV